MNQITRTIIDLVYRSLEGRNDNQASVYYHDLQKANIKFRRAELCFKELMRDGIMTAPYTLMYEVNKPLPNKPVIRASRSSTKDENYDIEVYTFPVDLTKLQQYSERPVLTPFLVPSNTKWQYITIRFIDGHEVEVKYAGTKQNSNYVAMGMQDKRTKTPDKQWELLEGLSRHGGETTNELYDEIRDLRNQIKPRKKLLSQHLRLLFPTVKEDPFEPYKAGRGFKTKFHLIPQSGVRQSGEVFEEDSRLEGIGDIFQS